MLLYEQNVFTYFLILLLIVETIPPTSKTPPIARPTGPNVAKIAPALPVVNALKPIVDPPN